MSSPIYYEADMDFFCVAETTAIIGQVVSENSVSYVSVEIDLDYHTRKYYRYYKTEEAAKEAVRAEMQTLINRMRESILQLESDAEHIRVLRK